ncbi:UvrB/UvrC motif-containing protein [Clostridium malenominatum]|uniref:UvrB/UvrC motif-containing protein n=1 Tax=Clostridium malenominatum TaxID=1539 RepID=A0ABP3UGW2_9CLOT
MLCERCNKNDANVHLTQVVNGTKSQHNLCENCAKEMSGFDLPVDMNLSSPFAFQNILSGIMDYINQPVKQEDTIEVKCSNCGTTYTDFRKKGLVGCSECYENLSNIFMPVIKRVQSNVEHTGKIPKRAGSHLLQKKKIDIFKEELRECIENEQYEKAAELRDMIKELQKLNEGEV